MRALLNSMTSKLNMLFESKIFLNSKTCFSFFIIASFFSLFLVAIFPHKTFANNLRCEDLLSSQNQFQDEFQNQLQNQAQNNSLSVIPEKPASYIGEDGKIYISADAAMYANQPVDTKKFRAPQITRSDAQAKTITIKNFLHDNHFHEIEISFDAIESVRVQKLPFPIIPGVIAGHVQDRFVFKKGQEPKIISTEGSPTSPISLIEDLVISYEAALPIGGMYNFAIGTLNANPLVGRVLSGSQKHSEGPDRQVIQYTADFTPQEQALLLEYYIRDSAKNQMNLYYNTVTQNCTTTIFDGIDSLPRFRNRRATGSLRPFLTNIGGDPVIGPARQALIERFGHTLLQVQELNEERNGIFYSKPVSAENPAALVSFAPGGKNPMTLVMLTTDTSHLTDDQKSKIKVLKNEIMQSLPETMNMMITGATALGQNLQSSSELIKAMMKVIQQRFQERLKRLNLELPEKAVALQILFTPYPAENSTSLLDRGYRAQLPFAVRDIELNSTNQSEILSQIDQGIDEVEANASSEVPAFLKNLGIRFQLQKNRTTIRTQFLLGLQALRQQQQINNDQINIHEIEIPQNQDRSLLRRAWDRIRRNAPQRQSQLVSLLVDHEQELSSANVNNTIRAQFGAHPEILSTDGSEGLTQILPAANNKYLCFGGLYPHTPRLNGRLNQQPFDANGRFGRFLNWILRDRPVTLSITHLDMNLERLELESVRLRIGAMGLRCLELESVNRQFNDEANSVLRDLIQRVGSPLPFSTNTLP